MFLVKSLFPLLVKTRTQQLGRALKKGTSVIRNHPEGACFWEDGTHTLVSSGQDPGEDPGGQEEGGVGVSVQRRGREPLTGPGGRLWGAVLRHVRVHPAEEPPPCHSSHTSIILFLDESRLQAEHTDLFVLLIRTCMKSSLG